MTHVIKQTLNYCKNLLFYVTPNRPQDFIKWFYVGFLRLSIFWKKI